jgi:FMN phosphatase YigB (HAD superfamily)
VKSSNAVYVGDTPDIDVVGAKLAGMKSVLIRDPLKEGETFAMPDRIISNLSELISVIPQL